MRTQFYLLSGYTRRQCCVSHSLLLLELTLEGHLLVQQNRFLVLSGV
jgi:hypothetical protein